MELTINEQFRLLKLRIKMLEAENLRLKAENAELKRKLDDQKSGIGKSFKELFK